MLSFNNSKLKRDGITSFSLPAVKTCPQAGLCKVGCYATQGFFNMPNVKKSLASNLLATKKVNFVGKISQELHGKKVKILRVHASGDFYNQSYLNAWLAIAVRNPHVKFYAYTKQVLMVKLTMQKLIQTREMPQNFSFIFSLGGKQDSMISVNQDRHSRVFASLGDLKTAGYADVTTHDIGAMGPNHKIGLVYHGAKTKKWSN